MLQSISPGVCLKPWFYVVGAWGNWSSSEPSDSLFYQQCAALGSEFDRYLLVDQECSTQLGYICDIRESRLLFINVDPVRFSSRTSLELEFEFQDTTGSKIGCIQ